MSRRLVKITLLLDKIIGHRFSVVTARQFPPIGLPKVRATLTYQSQKDKNTRLRFITTGLNGL